MDTEETNSVFSALMLCLAQCALTCPDFHAMRRIDLPACKVKDTDTMEYKSMKANHQNVPWRKTEHLPVPSNDDSWTKACVLSNLQHHVYFCLFLFVLSISKINQHTPDQLKFQSLNSTVPLLQS